MSDRSLEVQRLHLWRGDRHVLRGVDFSLGGGELLEITGSNGAGKTTLLRTLSGLMHPEEGRVLWGGQEIGHDMRSFHSQLAYLGHEPPLKSDLTAAENLRYWVGLRHPVTEIDLDRSLQRVGAAHWRDRPVRTLSAGQKRRVALASLALFAVPLWLLDEPATHLDREGQAMVGQLIEEHLGRGGLAVAAVHQELALVNARIQRLELADI